MKAKSENEHLPPYLGVYNSLYSDIINGVYAPEETLPGETVLAAKYSVSRNTLRQALAILNEDGLIIKSQGKGTVIAPHSQIVAEDAVTNPLITLCKENVTHTAVSYNYSSPTEIARNKLRLTENSLVLACNCIYYAGKHTLSYSFTQVPSTYFKALNLKTSEEDSIRETITETIFHNATQADMTIKLIYANEMETEFLPVALETPLLLIESILTDKTGSPFARCKSYLRPEYYHLAFQLR